MLNDGLGLPRDKPRDKGCPWRRRDPPRHLQDDGAAVSGRVEAAGCGVRTTVGRHHREQKKTGPRAEPVTHTTWRFLTRVTFSASGPETRGERALRTIARNQRARRLADTRQKVAAVLRGELHPDDCDDADGSMLT
jgi:hypothetical protein